MVRTKYAKIDSPLSDRGRLEADKNKMEQAKKKIEKAPQEKAPAKKRPKKELLENAEKEKPYEESVQKAVLKKEITPKKKGEQAKKKQLALETMQECLQELLQASVKGAKERELLGEFGIEPEEVKWAHILAKVLFEKAQEGDMTAFKELLSILGKGSKPQSVEAVGNVKQKSDTISKFEAIVRELQSGK